MQLLLLCYDRSAAQLNLCVLYPSDEQRHTNQFVDTSTSKDCIVLGKQRQKILHDAVDGHKMAADCVKSETKPAHNSPISPSLVGFSVRVFLRPSMTCSRSRVAASLAASAAAADVAATFCSLYLPQLTSPRFPTLVSIASHRHTRQLRQLR